MFLDLTISPTSTLSLGPILSLHTTPRPCSDSELAMLKNKDKEYLHLPKGRTVRLILILLFAILCWTTASPTGPLGHVKPILSRHIYAWLETLIGWALVLSQWVCDGVSQVIGELSSMILNQVFPSVILTWKWILKNVKSWVMEGFSALRNQTLGESPRDGIHAGGSQITLGLEEKEVNKRRLPTLDSMEHARSAPNSIVQWISSGFILRQSLETSYKWLSSSNPPEGNSIDWTSMVTHINPQRVSNLVLKLIQSPR